MYGLVDSDDYADKWGVVECVITKFEFANLAVENKKLLPTVTKVNLYEAVGSARIEKAREMSRTTRSGSWSYVMVSWTSCVRDGVFPKRLVCQGRLCIVFCVLSIRLRSLD